MTTQSLKGLALSFLALATGGGATALHAEALPSYRAEPCCQLCPAAHTPAAYNTKYLTFFTTLVEAPDNWLFRTENDLRTQFGPSAAGYQQLGQLHDALKAKGTELVVVYQPTRGLVHPNKLNPADRQHFDYELATRNYAAALQKFRDQGIWVPDLTPLLDEKSGEDRNAFFFKGDHHWTPHGAERTAREVAQLIKKIPGFADIPHKEFATQRTGLLGKRGTLHKAAGQICGTGYADQYVDRFNTEPVGVETSSDDLFGDEAAPQIVLVGTSNSGENYNFGGFLEENLGAEVLNASMTGGGYDGALIQYLGSEEFQKKPPKILIWEFETHYDLAQPGFYREVLPLVANNGCAGTKVAIKNDGVPLRSGMTQVLLNASNANLTSRDHVLEVRYDDPSITSLRGIVWYMTGKKDSIKIEHGSGMDTGGRFVTSLRKDSGYGDLTVLGMDVELPEGAKPGTKVSAALCAAPKIPSAGALQAHRE